ncbi:MAG: VgrG-related protein [Anaerolineae bacterium]
MPPARQARTISHIAIKVGGADLAHELMDALIDVVVDTSLHMPAMFTMRFHDDHLRWIDDNTFRLGAPVEIAMTTPSGTQGRVITGEITAIEPEFSAELTVMLVIRGYDRSHRLNRGTKSRVFVQATDSDMVQQIATDAGLQAEVQSTSEVYEHIFQQNQTDLAFVHERAERLGYEVFVDDTKLYFRQPRGDRGEVALTWGETLRAFYPRLTVVGQVDEVIVKGWDVATKRAIVGQASSTDIVPEIHVGGSGIQVAHQALSSAARQVVVRQPVASQGDADAMAQAVLDHINAGFVEAEGVAAGNPELVAGKKMTIEGVGNRFKGSYMITSASHVYTQEGYEVHLRVEGARPRMMADLLTEAASNQDSVASTWGGVVPAIVTNNDDPQHMGRVKLKFPWIDDSLESGWARVMAIGGGANRGLLWIPEVNDEVLVAFEHGNFDYPYIVGGLWNGADSPPGDISNAIKNGNVEIRTLQTREGHKIRLVDDSSNAMIEIVDYDGTNKIQLDTKNKKLVIKTSGDVSLEAQGKVEVKATSDLQIKGQGNVSVEASGQLTLRGATVNIN